MKQVKARFLALFRWPDGGRPTRASRRLRAQRPGRISSLACETLEGRVVLSGWGGDLLDGLSGVGVVTSVQIMIPNRPWGGPGGSFGGQNSPFAQLNSDLDKLQGDLQSLVPKSGVTLADLNNLNSDNNAIVQAGFQFDPQSLHTATYQLATAVVSGGDTSQAESNFAAQFDGSKVSQSVIEKTTSDVIQTIKASNITSDDLSTIAADQSAIESDLGGSSAGLLLGGNGSEGGNRLLAALANLGIVTSVKVPAAPPSLATGPGSTLDSRVAQLNTDLQKLQTDLQGLLAKSQVTLADLNNLNADSQAFAKAGVVLNSHDLPKVVSEIATAVTSGAATTQAKSDFQALFQGSSVSTTVIDKAFEDLMQTIEDSKATPSDLSTIAADQAAVSTDESNLHDKSADQNGLPPITTITGVATGAGSSLGTTGSENASGTGSATSSGSSSTSGGSQRAGGRHRSWAFLRPRRR